MNPGEGSGMAQILNNDQFLMATMPETNLAIVPVRYKPLWQDVTPVVTVPDDDLLVTHINQTADLLIFGLVKGTKVGVLVDASNANCSLGKLYDFQQCLLDPNYYSCDIHHLQSELQRSEEVLRTIKEMRQGLLGDTLISIMQEISEEVAKLPSAHFLPKPPMHDRPLSIEMPNFLPKTSADWLKTNGLKAKKLSLYQILAPNAFSPIEDFVPILRKTVSSTLHEGTNIDRYLVDQRHVHNPHTALLEASSGAADDK
ncbi:VWA3A protein, partial [Polypterus senegalus]